MGTAGSSSQVRATALYAIGDETFLDCDARDLVRVTSGCLTDEEMDGLASVVD